jgi:hypothetical protein
MIGLIDSRGLSGFLYLLPWKGWPRKHHLAEKEAFAAATESALDFLDRKLKASRHCQTDI